MLTHARRVGLAIVTASALLVGLAVRSAVAADVTLLFTYGSEKEEWVKEVTKSFNDSNAKLPSGNRVVVQAVPLGSGEAMQELLDGKRQAHLVSPASDVFIELYNARAGQPLVGQTRELVRSPVVIAMWEPAAKAIGWGVPGQEVGWEEILDLVNTAEGWKKYDFPEWGKFKFGHTHPEYSNSGLLSLIAVAYAGAGKTSGLTAADVDNPATAKFLRQIESSVVHYGSSTGFFGRKMFDSGPEYLSAAVLYENMVVESYSEKNRAKGFPPVVAIYPKEGTFWSNHPVGVVQRPWVTDEQKKAADLYVNYLLARPQQEKAIKYGFRPGDPTVALKAPLDAAHGVNPKEPGRRVLPVPKPAVIEKVLELWRKNKKQANVVLVVDVSGSMQKEGRMEQARPAAVQLVQMLGDDDKLSLLTFSNRTRWEFKNLSMKDGREQAVRALQAMQPFGQTALYDAVAEAYKHVEEAATPEQIPAIVVLSDGEDNKSTVAYEDLLKRVKFDPDERPFLIFTIGYGSDANEQLQARLQGLSAATQARSYKGAPDTIRKVLEENAAFFGSGAGK